MAHGESEIDLQSSDVARFYEHQKTREHVQGRAAEGFNKTYGIVHPARAVGVEPRRPAARRSTPREQELGAVFFEAAGWERPHWYESNAALLEEYGDRINAREAEWDSRWWSPIINAEHLAMRDRAAMFDLTAFCVFDITGPGALDVVQKVSMRQMDVAVGQVVYTPVLTPSGGFRSDLTVMRLGDEHFRVVTGGAHGMADLKWYARPPARRRQRADLRPHLGAGRRSASGGRGRATSSRASRRDDVSHEGFPFATCRTIEIGPLRVLASRISYVGDLGWELYVPIEQGARLWDIVWEAGEPHGIVPAGIGVYGTTGRLEKCYRAFGFELDGEYNVVEAGMAWGKVKDQDFVGKEAHVAPPRGGPGGDHVHADGRRPHLGERREALHARRRADRHARRSAAGRRARPPLVRDERGRRAVDRQAHPDVVPAARAREGRRGAARRVHGRALSGHGRDDDSTPLFDPDNARSPLVRILVCVKRVPMTGGKMVLTADEQALETRHLGFTICPHEECGVEEAVRHRRGARRRGRRAHARAARGGGAVARRAWRSAPTGRSIS